MTWYLPIDFTLVPTRLRDTEMSTGETQLPLWPHPGAFAARRRYDVHTGVDLYCPEGTAVVAVEDGVIVAVENFTGPDSDPPTPWWLPTQAVLVEGASGVILYGEIATTLAPGIRLHAGDVVGNVKRVLKNDKGYPTSMLHLELHETGTRVSAPEWPLEPNTRPPSLRDPTLHLLQAIGKGP